MQFRVKSVSCWVVLATLLVLGATSPKALADKKRGRHHGRGGGHRSSGFHIGLTPGGVSYGYHNRDFSIAVGPSNHAYDYGYYPSHASNYNYSSPDDYSTPHYYGPSGYGNSSGRVDDVGPLRPYGREIVQPPSSAPPSAHDASPEEIPPPNPVAPAPPLTSPLSVATSSVVPTNRRAADFQHGAEQAFRNGEYEAALRLTNHAILEDSENGKLLLFQSQVQFAVGDYTNALMSLETAMDLVGARERGFVVEHYRRLYKGRAYVDQMDRLVQYSKEHPESEHALVLRAYHYVHLGHENAAQILLQNHKGLSNGNTKLVSHVTTTLGSRFDVPPRPVPATAITEQKSTVQ